MIGDGLGGCCFDMSGEVVDQVLEDRLIEVDAAGWDNDGEQSGKYFELKDHGVGQSWIILAHRSMSRLIASRLSVVPDEGPVLGIIGIEAEAGHDLPDLIGPLTTKGSVEVHQILITDDMKGVIHLDLCVHLFGGQSFGKQYYISYQNLFIQTKSPDGLKPSWISKGEQKVAGSR